MREDELIMALIVWDMFAESRARNRCVLTLSLHTSASRFDSMRGITGLAGVSQYPAIGGHHIRPIFCHQRWIKDRLTWRSGGKVSAMALAISPKL